MSDANSPEALTLRCLNELRFGELMSGHIYPTLAMPDEQRCSECFWMGAAAVMHAIQLISSAPDDEAAKEVFRALGDCVRAEARRIKEGHIAAQQSRQPLADEFGGRA